MGFQTLLLVFHSISGERWFRTPLFRFDLIVLFYVFSNGKNVEGTTHRYVVELIKSGGDQLTLTLLSVSPSVSDNLFSFCAHFLSVFCYF